MSVRIPDTQRVRVELDNFKKTGAANDRIAGGAATFARGSNLRLEFALFYGEELADPSAITTARLRILNRSTAAGSVAMDKTIGLTAMKPGLTQEEWEAGGLDDAHLVFQFSAAECAASVFAGGDALAATNTFWFQLTYGTDDTTWFAGTILTFDPGYDAPGNAPPADPTNISREEVVALLAAMGDQFVKYVGNPNGWTIELRSKNGTPVRYGANDNGDPDIGTQTNT